jgi:hypothetical protein
MCEPPPVDQRPVVDGQPPDFVVERAASAAAAVSAAAPNNHQRIVFETLTPFPYAAFLPDRLSF